MSLSGPSPPPPPPQDENDEMGRELAEGKIHALEAQLAMAKEFTGEVRGRMIGERRGACWVHGRMIGERRGACWVQGEVHAGCMAG